MCTETVDTKAFQKKPTLQKKTCSAFSVQLRFVDTASSLKPSESE